MTLVRQEQTSFDQAALGVKATAANSLAHYDDLVGTLQAVFNQKDPPSRSGFADLVADLDLREEVSGRLRRRFRRPRATDSPGALLEFNSKRDSELHGIPGPSGLQVLPRQLCGLVCPHDPSTAFVGP